jgi:hypothetical protein
MTPAAYKDIVVACMKEAMCASGGGVHVGIATR